jgi:hypothetical protein
MCACVCVCRYATRTCLASSMAALEKPPAEMARMPRASNVPTICTSARVYFSTNKCLGLSLHDRTRNDDFSRRLMARASPENTTVSSPLERILSMYRCARAGLPLRDPMSRHARWAASRGPCPRQRTRRRDRSRTLLVAPTPEPAHVMAGLHVNVSKRIVDHAQLVPPVIAMSVLVRDMTVAASQVKGIRREMGRESGLRKEHLVSIHECACWFEP